MRKSARLAYCVLFTLAMVLAWVLRDFAKPLIDKIPCAHAVYLLGSRSITFCASLTVPCPPAHGVVRLRRHHSICAFQWAFDNLASLCRCDWQTCA